MKTAPALILALAVAALFAQGPLDPTGAPRPTMKTLVQIEPRIEINSENTPGDGDSLFEITAPGSYYLSGNVAGIAGKSGIEIAADDVTLDLNGFQLVGVAGSLDGIVVGAVDNLAIHNGSMRGWGRRGLNGQSARSGVFSALRATGNGTDGMNLGDYATVERCTARNNAGHGIVTAGNSTLDRCTAIANPGSGIRVASNCRVSGCTVRLSAIGIDAASGKSVISDCTVESCSGEAGISVGNNGIVKNSTSVSNVGAAKGILGGTACKFVDCIAESNPGNGMEAGAGSTLSGCTSSGNTTGILVGAGSTLSGCTAYNNSQSGIDAQDGGGTAGCTLIGCTARSNGADGIQVGDGSTIRDCTSSGNLQHGINTRVGCTVSGCTVFANTLDGVVTGNGSTVSGCTACQNGGDGIRVSDACRVVGNNSSGNGAGAGISALGSHSRIDGNHVNSNSYGIQVQLFGNLVVRNSTGNTNSIQAYNNSFGNPIAEIIIGPGAGFTATNPFANFTTY